MLERPARILPVIVVFEPAGTALWFAGNAVIPELQSRLGLPAEALGHITAAVQAGFLAGTLTFAVLAVSDRYYAAHKTAEVKAWLAKHPRFHLHFTPTSASWLNLVERFFADITTKRIRRGAFTSVADLQAGDPRDGTFTIVHEPEGLEVGPVWLKRAA